MPREVCVETTGARQHAAVFGRCFFVVERVVAAVGPSWP